MTDAVKTITFQQAMDDVEARFICPLTSEELAQSDRLFFQIEQAHWYYEDFKADKYSNLPHFSTLKSFATKLYDHSSLLKQLGTQFQEFFADYRAYKSKIPVYGCILLNPKCTKFLLVRDWHSNSWMFPRGKVNENESEFQCAIREVQEEIGFDATNHCKAEDYLVNFQDGKHVKLFIGLNVPESSNFATKTRKEISKIEFFPIDNVPKSSHGVLPFIPKLRRWLKQNNKLLAAKSPMPSTMPIPTTVGAASFLEGKINFIKNVGEISNTKTKLPSKGASAKAPQSYASAVSGAATTTLESSGILASPALAPKRGGGSSSAKMSDYDQRNKITFQDPLDPTGGVLSSKGKNATGWKVDDMFKANAKLTGRNYSYNGNPHEFGMTHPKYIDYNKVAESTPAKSAGTRHYSEDLGLYEISQQSLRGYELLKSNRNPDAPEIPPELDLTNTVAGGGVFNGVRGGFGGLEEQLSGEPYNWKSPKFVLPFRFDVASIMEAVDRTLGEREFYITQFS